MTTKKQNKANQQNAILSTGPKTIEGKAIIASNAIKHGIFTKDLILASGKGHENKEEYLEIFNNLISCLAPQNQMENLLVEKIAIDFWRLKRVIRFETGSISKYLEEIFKDFYSPYNKKDNIEIENEIEHKKSLIEWNILYIEYLQKGEVIFDQPTWTGQNIDSDIIEDFYLIIRNISYEALTKEEKEKLYHSNFAFSELKTTLKRIGYASNNEISSKLIDLYIKQNDNLKEKIQDLEQEKIVNTATDLINTQLCAIPKDENIDKILKYERPLQKSIFQNLILLKKLQQSF